MAVTGSGFYRRQIRRGRQYHSPIVMHFNCRYLLLPILRRLRQIQRDDCGGGDSERGQCLPRLAFDIAVSLCRVSKRRSSIARQPCWTSPSTGMHMYVVNSSVHPLPLPISNIRTPCSVLGHKLKTMMDGFSSDLESALTSWTSISLGCRDERADTTPSVVTPIHHHPDKSTTTLNQLHNSFIADFQR